MEALVAKPDNPSSSSGMHLPTLGRQRQEDICEFKASLGYRVSSRTARTKQRSPVFEKQNKTQHRQTKNLRTTT